MSLTEAEVESLRFHLGYGNIDVGAYPYTPDGFYELFNEVIEPNLTTGEETSATDAITADSVTEVTPLSMTDIVVAAELVVDVGTDAELVLVKAVTGSTFTARFAKAHSADGYPIAVNSGVARLRMLLHSANTCWQTLQSAAITKTAGLKAIGRKEVEWHPTAGATGSTAGVYKQTLEHYMGIVRLISQLVRVQPAWPASSGGSATLEAY